jgi:hypothetical protein
METGITTDYLLQRIFVTLFLILSVNKGTADALRQQHVIKAVPFLLK